MAASKRYRVIRSGPVLEHPPGETFEADIPPDQERFLLDIGALQVVPGPKPAPEKSKDRGDADRR